LFRFFALLDFFLFPTITFAFFRRFSLSALPPLFPKKNKKTKTKKQKKTGKKNKKRKTKKTGYPILVSFSSLPGGLQEAGGGGGEEGRKGCERVIKKILGDLFL